MNPLWNSVVVGGIQDGKPFLGFVDKIGVAYQDDVIATGFGTHLAIVRIVLCLAVRLLIWVTNPYPAQIFLCFSIFLSR
jgi:hypothetical protein